MKTLFLPALVASALAFPALADDSPAELFGQSTATGSGSPASMAMAAEKLQGDMVDEIIHLGPNEIVTRSTGVNAGTQQLATNMGVDANNYTVAELAKMFIGRYD